MKTGNAADRTNTSQIPAIGCHFIANFGKRPENCDFLRGRGICSVTKDATGKEPAMLLGDGGTAVVLLDNALCDD